jgi:tetratricopeptide (TPR) repeat protein
MSSIYDALKRVQGHNETQPFPASLQSAPARTRFRKTLVLAIAACLLCLAGAVTAVIIAGDRGDQGPSGKAVPAGELAAGTGGRTPAGLSADGRSWPALPEKFPGAGAGATAGESGFHEVEDYLRQGERHYQEGQYDRALAVYTRAMRFSRKDARLMNNMGIVMLAKEQPDRAVSYFRQAGSLSPGAVEPVYNLACAYARLGDADQALSHLKTACTMNPEAGDWAARDPDLLVLKGTGDFDEIVGVQ